MVLWKQVFTISIECIVSVCIKENLCEGLMRLAWHVAVVAVSPTWPRKDFESADEAAHEKRTKTAVQLPR